MGITLPEQRQEQVMVEGTMAEPVIRNTSRTVANSFSTHRELFPLVREGHSYLQSSFEVVRTAYNNVDAFDRICAAFDFAFWIVVPVIVIGLVSGLGIGLSDRI